MGTFADALWNELEAESATPVGSVVAQRSAGITVDAIRAAEALVGVSHTSAQRQLMVELLQTYLASYQAIDLVPLANRKQPAFRFSAILPGRRYVGSRRAADTPATSRPDARRPSLPQELAFLTAVELAELVRTRQVTSVELTALCIRRLKRFDPDLRCVISLMEDHALRRAAEADRQIAAGRYHGPLHGIPYGVKDILAVPGTPTTWGAALYKDRMLTTTATVVERLNDAGAVLVAKLSMGELGLSDRWYAGRTMSAWQATVGATGSSSGSAVSVAAGLLPFAIGAETLGSIVVPASRNGVTGLRPTFGRVSRSGAMTLAWTLDKIGPMARCVEDCAVVLEAIAGPDGKDPTVEAIPYAWDSRRELSSVRVGYFKAAFDVQRSGYQRDAAALEAMRNLGVHLTEIALPTDLPVNALLIIRVEAAAALDEFVRAGGLPSLEEQHVGAWPNFVRAGRLVPAFEYIQANRIRTELMHRLDDIFQTVDVFISPSPAVVNLTGLTGHPCVVAPNGFADSGTPVSISFIGKPFGEAELCTVARAWQNATGWHRRHPPPFADT